MGRNTRQTNSTIKELTFGANAPATTSFVRQHFQEVCKLHSFDQDSMRLCAYCILNHIPLTTVSHYHDWRSWKLRLLQLYLTHKQAWKGNPKNLYVCLHQQVMSPQQVSVVCLHYWCQYHAVTSVSYMYFQSPCSARTCTTLWVGWVFFL